ncbi:MAG: DUF6371 domain-containing protein [Bacteroidota bacterium]
MIGEHRFILEKYKGMQTRHTCPGCNKPKEFTRYIDTENQGVYLAENVGKCNRENKCGYHYTPSQFFEDIPGALHRIKDSDDLITVNTRYAPPESPPIQFLPEETMTRTLRAYDTNNFVKYLVNLFGKEKALDLAELYKLGTAEKFRNHGGNSVVFWQIDTLNRIRQAKVMAYNPHTGRRIKPGQQNICFMGKKILNDYEANLKQCLFGAHILTDRKNDNVGIVESEKTAVIMAGFMPDVVWLATGGKNGANWINRDVYGDLKGRNVVLYPDIGATEAWSEKAKMLATVCNYTVWDGLENMPDKETVNEGLDIADFVIRQQPSVPVTNDKPEAQETDPVLTKTPELTPQGCTNETYQTINGEITVLIGPNDYPLNWDLTADNIDSKSLPSKINTVKAMAEVNPSLTNLVQRFDHSLEGVFIIEV